jgi:small neutral amino acid transporter SnatA (MarC family)
VTKASLVVIAIVCFAALAGTQLLKLFGISLDAFQVAAEAGEPADKIVSSLDTNIT